MSDSHGLGRPPMWRSFDAGAYVLFGGVLERTRQIVTPLGARELGDHDRISIAPTRPWLSLVNDSEAIPLAHDEDRKHYPVYDVEHDAPTKRCDLLQLNALDGPLFTVGICTRLPLRPVSHVQAGWLEPMQRWPVFLFGGILPPDSDATIEGMWPEELQLFDLLFAHSEAELRAFRVGKESQLVSSEPLPVRALCHEPAIVEALILPSERVTIQVKNPTDQTIGFAGAFRCTQ